MDETTFTALLPTGTELCWVAASYALGCFTAGWYWTRWRTGSDLRGMGSGTLGARNAGRALGTEGFVVTFVLDAAKGFLAVEGARRLGLRDGAVLAAMLAVLAGHLWPAQLGFRGGKGVVVSVGALLALDPFAIVCLAAVLVTALVVLRRFKVAGFLTIVSGPAAVAAAGRGAFVAAASAAVAAVVLFAHRSDIRDAAAKMRRGGPAAALPADGPGAPLRGEVNADV